MIAAGDIPSTKVYKDEKILAFRDIAPMAPHVPGALSGDPVYDLPVLPLLLLGSLSHVVSSNGIPSGSQIRKASPF
jgi:hypothetical protein